MTTQNRSYPIHKAFIFYPEVGCKAVYSKSQILPLDEAFFTVISPWSSFWIDAQNSSSLNVVTSASANNVLLPGATPAERSLAYA
jgi:hypothetical protein